MSITQDATGYHTVRVQTPDTAGFNQFPQPRGNPATGIGFSLPPFHPEQISTVCLLKIQERCSGHTPQLRMLSLWESRLVDSYFLDVSEKKRMWCP